MSKHPGRVVLKLEIILCRGNELIAGAIGGDMSARTLSGEIIEWWLERAITYISNVDFCLASKSASVNGRFSLAFVRETETRMPVNML